MRLKCLVAIFFLAGIIAPFGQEERATPPLPTTETAGASLPSNEELKSRLPTLTTEAKRQLLYLCARLNKPVIAERLAEEILAKSPGDRQTLLVMASLYLERKDAGKTRKTAREILKHHPGDSEGTCYLAAAAQLEGYHRQAENILQRLRSENFRNGGFPYENDLAAAAGDARDWKEAAQAYRRILDRPNTVYELERQPRLALEEIYRKNLPQVEFAANWYKLSNGNILRTSAHWESPLSTKQRLFLDWDRDDLSQESNTTSLNCTNDRNEGMVSVEHPFTEEWSTRLGVGGSGDGGRAAGQLRHSFDSQCELTLGIEYGRKSTDSLSLELLDGRQEQVSAGVNAQLTPTTSFRFLGNGRHVRVGDATLGEGFGFNLGVDQVLLKNPFELLLGYEGEVSSFSTLTTDPRPVAPLLSSSVDTVGMQGTLDNLISSDINRHSFVVTGRGHILPPWTWELSNTSGYSIDRGQVDYGFSGETGWLIRKSLELRMRAAWASSGSDSNQGSEVREISVVLKSWF
jgi:hypothetical protein